MNVQDSSVSWSQNIWSSSVLCGSDGLGQQQVPSSPSCLLSSLCAFTIQGIVCCLVASSTLSSEVGLSTLQLPCTAKAKGGTTNGKCTVIHLWLWILYYFNHHCIVYEAKIETKRFQLPPGLIYCWGPKCPSLLWLSMFLLFVAFLYWKKDTFLAITLTELLVCVSALSI